MRIAILALMMVLSASAQAQQKMTIGAGGASCGDYTKQEDFRIARNYWVLGYLSGMNMYYRAADILKPDAVSGNAITEAVALHCRNNPLDTLLNATDSVWFQLLDKYGKR